MKHYLIEFRFHGYARKYAKRLAFDVAKKFRVKGVTRKKVVPHITMFGPFTTRNERKMISEVANVAKNYTLVPFTVKGFNYFDNPSNKVIYLDIEPSEELKQLRYELSSRLRKITSTKSSQDRKSKDNFYFHATIAFKDIDRKFDKIWHYLKKKEEPNINQHLVRITILKGRRILREYDLLQKRLLTRKQSLNHQLFLQTIKILKKHLSAQKFKTEIIKQDKINTWEKIKSFFRK
jgi:2'-5' RNA ligase